MQLRMMLFRIIVVFVLAFHLLHSASRALTLFRSLLALIITIDKDLLGIATCSVTPQIRRFHRLNLRNS